MCGIAGIIDTGRGIGRDEIGRLATATRRFEHDRQVVLQFGLTDEVGE